MKEEKRSLKTGLRAGEKPQDRSKSRRETSRTVKDEEKRDLKNS